mgnify:CR=1 FL=1
MKKISVGVIGCGQFGEKHIAVYSQMETVHLEIICDLDKSRAESIAKKYNVPRWTTDVDEIFQDPTINAVSIVSPEPLHFEHGMKAFEGNKHVLIEKPMATDVEQTDKLIRTAREKNLVLMPGHILRFESRYILAYERLNALGKIYSIYSRRNLPKNLRSIYTRVHPAQMTLPHDIDLVLWFTNSEPKTVYSVERSTQHNDQIDMVWSLVEFKDGCIVCLESSWLLPEREGIFPDSMMEIIGENGSIKISYPSNDVVYYGEKGEEKFDTSLWPILYGELQGAIKNELEHFIQCVKERRYSNIVPPEVSAKSIRLTEAIISSAEASKVINLK